MKQRRSYIALLPPIKFSQDPYTDDGREAGGISVNGLRLVNGRLKKFKVVVGPTPGLSLIPVLSKLVPLFHLFQGAEDAHIWFRAVIWLRIPQLRGGPHGIRRPSDVKEVDWDPLLVKYISRVREIQILRNFTIAEALGM